MLTGQRPFSGDTATLLSSIMDTAASVTEINPAVPRDLGKIVKRCHPALRFYQQRTKQDEGLP